MPQETFQLLGKPFIQLNQLLKIFGLAENGGHANTIISEGVVEVNGKPETQKRKKLAIGDVVVFQDTQITIA